MLNDKLLEPFRELCLLVPDVNDKRAKTQGQFVFTEDPLDWTEKFPRFTININNFSVTERPAQQSISDQYYSFTLNYDVKISYFTKRMDDYECHDGVLRKGKLFIEFMSLNVIIPTILRNKILLCQKYNWLETVNLKTVEKIEDVENYGHKQDFILNVTATYDDKIPISNDGYINTIDLNSNV